MTYKMTDKELVIRLRTERVLLIDKLKKTLDLLKEHSMYLDSLQHKNNCKGDCER